MVSPEVGAILHHIIIILYYIVTGKSKWGGLEWRKENVSTLLLSILFILAFPSERKRESVKERERERERERENENERELDYLLERISHHHQQQCSHRLRCSGVHWEVEGLGPYAAVVAASEEQLK